MEPTIEIKIYIKPLEDNHILKGQFDRQQRRRPSNIRDLKQESHYTKMHVG
jgi:hypothetical protein